MTEFKDAFGHRLKVTRIDKRLSREELAEKAEVSAASIASYEQGDKSPLFETAYRLARALGVSPDRLCDFST